MSKYVCPTHYEPVTWRGTGCTQCAVKTPRPPREKTPTHGKRALAQKANRL